MKIFSVIFSSTSVLLCFLLVLSGFASACATDREYDEKHAIEGYRQIIGLTESELVAIYGDAAVRFSWPLHDPGMYEHGLKIEVDSSGAYVRLESGRASGVFFNSSRFWTDQKMHVGNSYCDVLTAYPDAHLTFGYEEGGELFLIVNKDGLLFEFSTAELPLEEYLANGEPKRNSQSLCTAVLTSIEIHAQQ